MKEMTIEDVHGVTLNIMKEIHEFCVANDIKYSLAYGSLIGAIRHTGFIPWDDDIDVWMTRPMYEKFTKTFVSKNGYRHSSMYDKDSLICFSRVYEVEKTSIRMNVKSCDGDIGVFVDILPLDGVPNNEAQRTEQYKDFSKMISCLYHARYWMNYIERNSGLRKVSGMCHLLYNMLKRGSYHAAHERMISIAKEYSFENSDYCCYFQCGDAYRKNQQELLPTSCFDNYVLKEFEDTELMIIEEYDKILNRIYGDYMVLPPIEARSSRSHGSCYWK